MQNIDYLCTKSRSKTWSTTGWQKVVVCIVSDGRAKINPRTLAVIQKLGCYQPGQAKNVSRFPASLVLADFQLKADSTELFPTTPDREREACDCAHLRVHDAVPGQLEAAGRARERRHDAGPAALVRRRRHTILQLRRRN